MANTQSGQTNTPQFNIKNEENLKSQGYIMEVLDFVSSVTKIRYRFPRYVNQGRTEIYMPIIVEDDKHNVLRSYIKGNSTLGQPSDAENFIASNPNLKLIIYPNPKDQNILPYIKGMERALNEGYFLVAPEWCSVALFSFEAYVGTHKWNDFTTVLGDRIVFGENGVEFNRKAFAASGRQGFQNTSITDALGMKAVVKGEKGETVQEFKWKDFESNQGFMSKYIKRGEMKPTPDITVDVIGRPFCLDLISEFIIPTIEKPAIPVVVSTPAPSVGNLLSRPEAANIPSGFQPPPSQQPSVYAGRAAPSSEIITLSSDIISRLEKFLRNEECKKSNQIRLDSLVKKIIDEAPFNYDKFNGRHLNLSTCQFGKINTKTIYGRVLSLIPNSNQSLNLSINHEDLSLILTGSPQTDLNDQRLTPYIDELFRKAEKIIFGQLGTTTKYAEQGVISVPASILESIPTGPNPSGLPKIVSKSPFIETFPLAGVTEVVNPVTDGKRCIPGIMAKKRD